MKFREHRGSLADAMETVIEVADRPALVRHLQALLEPWGWFDCNPPIADGDVEVEPYGRDDRIGWDTHIVKLRGYGVIGFTNGAL